MSDIETPSLEERMADMASDIDTLSRLIEKLEEKYSKLFRRVRDLEEIREGE